MMHAAISVRLFAGMLSMLLYKLVFWSDRAIGCGTVLALVILAAAATVLVFVPQNIMFEDVWEGACEGARSAVDATEMFLSVFKSKPEL